MTKPYEISKYLILEAYRRVKENGGTFGVDKESIQEFEKDLKGNLYKIWNRMSSGSYFPPPVLGVAIPKKSGGKRMLGIPTVSDRVAQAAVKLMLEPVIDPIFHENSYGYRPNKSAHDAIAITRQRCWRNNWVVEFDIKGLFDNIDHELLMKAVRKHCDIPWAILYIERWLKAPMQMPDGSMQERTKGTPQGGVISPILANLFLHYAFDKWVSKHMEGIEFCRYADDGLLHCKSLKQAEFVLMMITKRFKECGLEIHPTKSKIIYCKHALRKEEYENISFTFLGYTFKPRVAKNREEINYLNFLPGVSKEAMKAMNQTLRGWKLQLKNEWHIEEIAGFINPVLQGWHQYYGKFYKTAMKWLWRNINDYLCKWIMRKYRKYKRHKVKAFDYLARIAKSFPNLFVHWRLGYIPTV
jgi:RNA-directed DNA polymerase